LSPLDKSCPGLENRQDESRWRAEIEARDPSRLDEAVAAATDALVTRFGPTDLDGRIRGFVITATAP